MEAPQPQTASLDDRIRERLECNARQRRESVEQIRRTNAQFEELVALNQVWYKFQTRHLFSIAPPYSADYEHEAAIGDVLSIGRALCDLGLMPRVAEWASLFGLSGVVTERMIRDAADGNRDAVSAAMRQFVLDEQFHTIEWETSDPDDLTSVYAHLTATLPAALGMPFTRAGVPNASPVEYSEDDEVPVLDHSVPIGEFQEQNPPPSETITPSPRPDLASNSPSEEVVAPAELNDQPNPGAGANAQQESDTPSTVPRIEHLPPLPSGIEPDKQSAGISNPLTATAESATPPAASLPLSEREQTDSSSAVATTTPSVTIPPSPIVEETTPLSLEELLVYAQDELIGQMSIVLVALCQSPKPVRIADLNVLLGEARWTDARRGFTDLCGRLNDKIIPFGWRVRQRNKAGRLVRLPKVSQ